MHNRPPGPNSDPEFRAIGEQAAAWFGRCEIGLTPEQKREFMRWLEADERHGEALRDMDETWDFLDGLKEIKRPVMAPAREPSGISPATRRFARPLIFAAAAAVALAFAGLWAPWNEAPIVREAITEAGGMKKLELPDGSIVYLNASSGAKIRFTETIRLVELLHGEAHFAVAKDAARPFVVTTGEVAVKAVGTAFNVRREAQTVEVFVTEGKVRLEDATKGASLLSHGASPTTSPPRAPGNANPAPASPILAEPGLLVAGQRASVPLSATAAPQAAVIAPIAAAEMQQALAWRARQLEFDMTPLTQVVAEFNRYNGHQLVIDDVDLGRQPFGGSFQADNTSVFV
ncbi:MAG: FecR family protein, partial [Opitutaceae bacterium]